MTRSLSEASHWSCAGLVLPLSSRYDTRIILAAGTEPCTFTTCDTCRDVRASARCRPLGASHRALCIPSVAVWPKINHTDPGEKHSMGGTKREGGGGCVEEREGEVGGEGEGAGRGDPGIPPDLPPQDLHELPLAKRHRIESHSCSRSGLALPPTPSAP